MSILDIMAKISGGVLQESMQDQIRLETMEDDATLVLKDGSLVSLIELGGAVRNPGEADIAAMADRMRNIMAPYFSVPGHALEVNFMRDSAAARRFLERQVERTKRGAHALQLDLDDVLQERVTKLSTQMVSEICLITVTTRPSVLDKEELADDLADFGKRMRGVPKMSDAQVPRKALTSAHARHAALVEALEHNLKGLGQIARALTVTESLQEIRAGLYPDTYPTKDEWFPNLPKWSNEGKRRDTVKPGGKALSMMPESPAQMMGNEFSNLGVPTFDHQLATEDSYIESTRNVRIGGMIFNSFDMTLAPEILPAFNDLVADITTKDITVPWRASMRLESGGVQSQALKRMYLGIFTWASPTVNRRIKEALEANVEIDGSTDNITRFRMSFSTWVPAGQDERLRKNAQIVMGAVKRWGNSGVDGISGDPMATTLSTMPGLTQASTAPVAAAPLRDALAMLPLARQGSPWEAGSMLFRTASGKPWPFQPGSAEQTTWITLIVGTPGSGKSVFMNAMNFASAIALNAAAGDDPVLPRISILDIGTSSAGVVSLLQESLPAHRRHEVLFSKLRNDRDHSINIFDTQLGMRKPMAADRQFLINFLGLLMSDGATPPSRAMQGLISATIDGAYEMLMDHRHPKAYLRNEAPIVDAMLDELGFEQTPETVWWEVVDFLFQEGKFTEAEIAQRHAVPTISDLVTASQADQVRMPYAGVSDAGSGQDVISAFQRVISEVVRDYPIMSSFTRFSIGSARVVALDLMDVTARGSGQNAQKQTGVMYMLARQVTTRDFFVDPEEIKQLVRRGDLPDFYAKHHIKAAKQMASMPKILGMDEYHRCSKIDAVNEQLMQDGREGRKFQVDIRVASQLIEDFPEPVIKIATGVVAFSVGSESCIDYLDDIFTLSPNDAAILRHNLNGPSSRGAPFWAMFKTKHYKQVRQEMLLTLGPVELWAYSTTASDVALRSALYEQIGPKATRQVLAATFPSGTAKPEIDKRMKRLEEAGERGVTGQSRDVVAGLIKELKERSYIMNQ